MRKTKGLHWKHQVKVLTRAVILALAAGGIMTGVSFAEEVKPITLNEETDKENHGSVMTVGEDGTLTYDFGNKVIDIHTGGEDSNEIPLGRAMADPPVKAVINAKTINLFAKETENIDLFGGSVGVYAPAGTEIVFNADVNIQVDNREGKDFFVYGIDVPMAGAQRSAVTVNGKFTIKGEGTDNTQDSYWGILTEQIHGGYSFYKGSRWAPVGVYLQGKHKSFIDLNGDVDIRVKGIGVMADNYRELEADAYTDKINMNKGKIYIETPVDTTEGYYSLSSFGGTVNVNMNDEETAALGHDVNIIGNLIAMTDDGNGIWDGVPTFYANGKINLGLSTPSSTLTGIIDNTGTPQAGVVNIFLSKGAFWDHKSVGLKNGMQQPTMPNPSIDHYGNYDGISHLTNLVGGAGEADTGYIKMTDEAPVEVENYSKYTTLIYEHDTTVPGDPNEGFAMKGGDFKIKKAAANSGITLRTDNAGLNTASGKADDKNLVSGTLNKLANKLYYMAYKDGEKNLTGKVEIAEGLTAQSASQRIEDITYKDADGQGQYLYTPAAEVYEGPIRTPERFTEDRVAVATEDDVFGTGDSKFIAGAFNSTKDKDMLVDMNGKALTISAVRDKKYIAYGIMGDGKNLTFINGKKDTPIHISVSGGTSRDAGIKAAAGGVVVIDHDVVIDKVEGYNNVTGVLAAAKSKIVLNGLKLNSALTSATGDNKSSVGIAAGGTVEIKKAVDLTMENFGTCISSAGMVDIAGGQINSGTDLRRTHGAISASGSGIGVVRINMNSDDTAGSNAVKIVGDIAITKGKLMGKDYDGRVYLGLNTGDSYWRGISDYTDSSGTGEGGLDLWLANGAFWSNERTSKLSGSTVYSLHGADDASHAGFIYQKDSSPATVSNYSGHTVVMYEHDTAAPEDPNEGLAMKGGDFRIGKAAAGSGIVLRTDNTGLNVSSTKAADKNLVSGTLNRLANKLYYLAYKDGEKNLAGKVEIAEGLTAQSAGMRIEDITYKDANGQGQYLYTPAEDEPEGEKFNKTITGGEDKAYADAGVKHGDSYNFTKDAVVDIAANGYGGYPSGVYIEKKGSFSITHPESTLTFVTSGDKSMIAGIETSHDDAKLTVNGKNLVVNVKNTGTGELAKAFGIYNFGKGNEIRINADTKVKTAGKTSYGIYATQDGIITLNGGNTTVSVNADAEGNSASIAVTPQGIHGNNKPAEVNVNYENNAIKDPTKTVSLAGDIFATTLKTGGEYNAALHHEAKVNLGLSGVKSGLDGVIGYKKAHTDADDYDEFDSEDYSAGTVQMALQDGALWTNRVYGTNNMVSKDWAGFAGSVLHRLSGGRDAAHAGVIMQKDSNPIAIDNYSGHTIVIYEHDITAPADPNEGLSMKGGDFRIGKADAGAGIVLRTDNTGLKTSSAEVADRNLVSGTLNKLANKLYYMAYKDGEKNLTGKVEIAEGLTARSASIKAGDITFKEADGQGQYLYTPAGTLYEGPIRTPETFTADRWAKATEQDAVGRRVCAAYNSTENPEMTVDMNGQALTLVADGGQTREAIGIFAENQTLKFINGKEGTPIKITAKESGWNEMPTGISVGKDGTVIIEHDVSIEHLGLAQRACGISAWDSGGKVFLKGLTIKEGAIETKDKRGCTAYGISAVGDKTLIEIEKPVDISLKGYGIYSRNGATVRISGGKIITDTDIEKLHKALYASGGYTQGAVSVISVNMNRENTAAGNHDVEILGDIATESNSGSNSNGIVFLGMNTEKSAWRGVTSYKEFKNGRIKEGDVNLWLGNGATWTNESTSLIEESYSSSVNRWSGSRIAALHGGSDAGHAGVVVQKDAHPITVKDYSGYTTVIYEHDTAVPAEPAAGLSMIGGDFKIGKAAAGSGITLRTDNAGLNTASEEAADKDLVNATLNNLANKLYYDAFKDGERNLTGKVEIAEGLTAQAARIRIEDISFKKTNGQGLYRYVPAGNEGKTGPITTSEDISVTREVEADGSVHVTWTEPNAESGKFVSTLYSEKSTTKQDPMVVNLDGQDLKLQANSANKIAAAVYVGNNQYIHINGNDTDHVIIEATNTDTRGANGIYLDGNAHLNVKGNVIVSKVVTKGDSASGIAFQGKDSEVVIDGNLKITDVYGERGKGAGINASGIAVTGERSKMTVTGPVSISGVKGSGLKTVGADTMISVGGGTIEAAEDGDKSHNYYAARVEKGTININMDGDQAGETKTNITGDMFITGQYGKKVIEYSGGQLVDWKNAGKLNVALTDDQSSWKGAAVYDQYTSNYGTGGNTVHDVGEFNLWLQNGAVWTNERLSHGTTTTTPSAAFIGSQIAHFHGDSRNMQKSVIYQNDENPIYVNTYSGNATVIYRHDASNPQQMIGGDFRITNAEDGSNITLLTDNAGITKGFAEDDELADKNYVNEVLNKLANKLWYANYTDGNLAGTVKIAEGLTATSKSLKMGAVTFSTESTGTGQKGQGFFDYPKTEPSGAVYQTPITGDLSATADPSQQVYKDAGILQADGTYKFKEDTILTVKEYPAAVDAKGNVVIDATGKTLTLSQEGRTEDTPIISDTKGKSIAITAKKLVVDAGIIEKNRVAGFFIQNNDKGLKNVVTVNGDVDITAISKKNTAFGIYASGDSTVTINGNLVMNKENDWAISGKGFTFYGCSGIFSTSPWGKYNKGAIVNINGDVDFKVNGNGAHANIGNGVINLNGGGKIEVNKANKMGYGALVAQCGTVNMNVVKDESGNVTGAGVRDVNIKGNVSAKTGAIHPFDNGIYSTVNLGLNTDKSTLEGIVWNGFAKEGNYNPEYSEQKMFYGRINLWLGNGATWTNAEWGMPGENYYGAAGDKKFHGSNPTNLYGGSDAAHAGVIIQKDKNPISVENYSGHTTVIYEHDTTVPGDPNEGFAMKGGDFRIEKAAANSGIILRTDNAGLNTSSGKAADKNLVSGTLNKLANKLYYEAYTKGEKNLTGKVEIAEGLTAQSASMKVGDITYKDEDGQGRYLYTPAVDIPDEQTVNPMTKPIDGSKESEEAYSEAGIYKKNDDEYRFTKNPAGIHIEKTPSAAIIASVKDITVKADGGLEIISNPEGIVADSGKTAAITAKEVSVKVEDGNAVKADNGTVNITGNLAAGGKDGIKAENNGVVTVNGKVDITAEDKAAEALAGGRIILNGGFMQGKVRADQGSVSGEELAVRGDITAENGGTVTLKGGKAGGDTVSAEGTGSNVTLDGGGYSIKMLKADNGGIITLKTNPESPSEIKGIHSGENSAVNVTVEGGTGKLAGDVTGTGAVKLALGNQAVWEGKSSNENTEATVNSTWKNTGETKLKKLGGSGTVDMTQSGEGKTEIKEYNGTLTLVYAHENANPVNMKGNNFHIGKAAKGSKIRMLTDNAGLNTSSDKAADKNQVSAALNALAGKLYYEAYVAGEKNLEGTVEIAEGLTAQSATKRLETMTYKAETGQGQYLYTPAVDPNPPIIYGDKETKMMRGSKTAMTSAILLWRANNNDLERRMGDIRLGKEENGIWARYLGGKNELDKKKTSFKQTYNIAQVGYDKKKGNWTIGAALDYGTGKDTYANGTGKEKLASLALYGAMQKEDGQYLDIILRGSRVKNDYTVYNEMNHRLDGKYRTGGLSVSMEYGKRMKKENGFYIDPSIELTAGRLSGKDYDAVSDMGGNKKMHIHQEGVTSVIGRIGLGIGKETERSNLFAKIGLAHEFGGTVKSIFSAEGEPTSGTRVDMKDSWIDLEVGGSWLVNRNTYLYGTYTRNFGADLSNKWRIDAGIRFSF